MNTMLKISISKSESIVLLIAIVSMVPFTFETEQAGLYINYFYIFLLFLPFLGLRYTKSGISLVAFYSMIYLLGLFNIYNNDWYYAIRVTASYVVFLIPFLITFVKLEERYFKKFLQAVVLVGVIYSLFLIYQILSIGYNGDFYKTKELMGSNRYGFVFVFGFFVLLFDQKIRYVIKVTSLTLLLIGLTLTFSRASIVAFGAAAMIFVIFNFKNLNIKYIIGAIAFGLVVVIVFRETIIGQIADFFGQYLLSYSKYNLTDSRSSEGYRLYVFGQIFDYVMKHPLFGSNYAGLYLLYDEYRDVGASAHNQYTDILLRTGFVGFSVFLLILTKMLKFYWRNYAGVFYGLIGIVVYGLFHETFKLAHGSFIFAMLLSHYLYCVEPKRKIVWETPQQN